MTDQEIQNLMAKGNRKTGNYHRTILESLQEIDEIEKHLFRAEILIEITQINFINGEDWFEVFKEQDPELFKQIQELIQNYTCKKLQNLSE
jgi:hypothetical protein